MAWFFKVAYEGGVPCAEQWLGPFDDEQAAGDQRDEVIARAAAVGRADTFTEPEDIADPRPSPVVMIVSDAEGVDWEVHEDGTRTLKPV
jgi:hypothetical protein